MTEMTLATTCARIVLIEDDAHMAALLQYNLNAMGHAVEWIDDGVMALARLLREPPDIVVLDWMLPRLSGIEIARRLRASARTCRTPVLMMTARSERHDRARALDVGVDVFLTKPFSLPVFMAELRALVQRALTPIPNRAQEIGS